MLLPGLSGCAQYSLPGLPEVDLQLCAGVPDRVGEARDTNGGTPRYWS